MPGSSAGELAGIPSSRMKVFPFRVVRCHANVDGFVEVVDNGKVEQICSLWRLEDMDEKKGKQEGV